MYSPTTRLLTVLELLQSYKEMSGAEIARRLEINRRTVRRYIAMLQAMGIPVEAERGPYGAYQLQRGYKLPPLMFTNEEAVALTLGLLAIREFQFPVDAAAVEGALAKTERVMPEKLLNQVRALQEAITFNFRLPPVQPQNEAVVLLSSAVRERQRVRVGYQSWNGDDSERDFDPYGVVLHEGYWYTAGYCHLRDDLRTFRLDRITRLELRDTSFERPVNFDALAHVLGSIATMPGDHQVKVLLKTTLEQAQRSISAEAGILEVTDEGILFRRAAYDMSWLVHYLLYLDFPVVVLEPPELRELMREIGEKALRMVSENDG
jgi:predicted DNA-binding transcriptional regulator YafY